MAVDIAQRFPSLIHQTSTRSQEPPGTQTLWSRFAFNSQQVFNLSYRIKTKKVELRQGLLHVELDIPHEKPLHIVAFHIKDKSFHTLGQTEMRRNESRLISRTANDLLIHSPRRHLLLIGALHDDRGSVAYRQLLGPDPTPLEDLRPLDREGTSWTCLLPERDYYLRTDFALVSPALAPIIDRAQTRLLPSSAHHRPI